ncbi:hypothetical protein ONZ45_g12466 [Pleurotus djamor]|nr:hypothetical protein ONZ45_g12466 [Pleurotus djamor]
MSEANAERGSFGGDRFDHVSGGIAGGRFNHNNQYHGDEEKLEAKLKMIKRTVANMTNREIHDAEGTLMDLDDYIKTLLQTQKDLETAVQKRKGELSSPILSKLRR